MKLDAKRLGTLMEEYRDSGLAPILPPDLDSEQADFLSQILSGMPQGVYRALQYDVDFLWMQEMERATTGNASVGADRLVELRDRVRVNLANKELGEVMGQSEPGTVAAYIVAAIENLADTLE